MAQSRTLSSTALATLRYLWASPATVAGLAVAAIACALGARMRRADGTLEVTGGPIGAAVSCLPQSMRFEAITLGHVIVGVDHARVLVLRAHERVHVAQYERWGPLFVPAYLACSVLAWIAGNDPYRDNRFEREAFARDDTRGGR